MLRPRSHCPVERKSAQAQREQDAKDKAITDSVVASVDAIKGYRHFDEMKADMFAYIRDSGFKRTPAEAYIHVLNEKILPTLSAKEQAQTVAALKTQAAASSGKPTATASATPTRPKSFDDPGLQW